jgi:anaerobic magnesium-protoporphyrin IX monomethyl ester cyclase
MKPDIVFVHPLFISKDPVEEKIMTPYFPLGLMYLASVVRNNGYTVDLFDCTFRSDFDEFEKYIRLNRPPVVGISSLITIRRNALILADIAHRYGSRVLVGGPDPTAIPERYLHYRGTNGSYPVDYVVFDEGELITQDLVDYIFQNSGSVSDLREISGLRYRGDDGSIISTGNRELIQDLDSLPFPARDLIDIDAYRRAWMKKHGYWSLSIINTRGCPYGCSWCQKAVFGKKYRSRSPENSAREMKLIKDTYAPDQIRVVDDITGVRRNWVLAWHDAILKNDAVIPFECLTRVNLVDREVINALKEAGCKMIYFGAESGSQKVLDAMDKGIKVEQIYSAARMCKEAGIETYFFMMVAYPQEDFEDIKLSVKMLRETVPDIFSTTIAYPLPGTKFYEQVRDRMMFDSEWTIDWDYTAENKLLFRREKYSTTFYRWVVRWLHREWKNQKLKEQPGTSLEKIRNFSELLIVRILVRVFALAPVKPTIRFRPAEGR